MKEKRKERDTLVKEKEVSDIRIERCVLQLETFRREEEERKEMERLEKLKESLGFQELLISAGSFMMGPLYDLANRSDNEVQHEVTLTQDLKMMKYTVTQALWESVMGENPSDCKGCLLYTSPSPRDS